jgi:hypothetical protein
MIADHFWLDHNSVAHLVRVGMRLARESCTLCRRRQAVAANLGGGQTAVRV